MPDGVGEIGDLAYTGCTNLTKVRIPISVESIGTAAFDKCSKLTEVICLIEKPKAITRHTFSNYAKAHLHVPYNCKKNYLLGKYWTDFLKITEDAK